MVTLSKIAEGFLTANHYPHYSFKDPHKPIWTGLQHRSGKKMSWNLSLELEVFTGPKIRTQTKI